MRSRTVRLKLVAIAMFSGSAGSTGALELGQPVACELGKTCFVQNYVDVDPSSAIADYRCGSATYDGHTGTDFRLLSTKDVQRNVEIIAAAPGVVKGRRDGMADRLIRDRSEVPSRRACGNGVVIDHGQGWETQYCHMRRGSVRVRKGERVARGDVLGYVGYSGVAQFAHLHFSVRHNGQVMDPYSGTAVGQRCGGQSRLFARDVPDTYTDAQLIEAGFTTAPLTTAAIERGQAVGRDVKPTSRALVFFARFMNLKKSDTTFLEIRGPSGFAVKNAPRALERNKAQYVSFVGKRLRQSRWPAGRYTGRVMLERGGAVLRRHKIVLTLP